MLRQCNVVVHARALGRLQAVVLLLLLLLL